MVHNVDLARHPSEGSFESADVRIIEELKRHWKVHLLVPIQIGQDQIALIFGVNCC